MRWLAMSFLALFCSSSLSAAVVQTNVLWPAVPDPSQPGQTYTPVRVCTVDPGVDAALVTRLKNALGGSWAANSRVKFFDFRPCTDLTIDEQKEAVGWHYSLGGDQNSQVGTNGRGMVTPTNFAVQSGRPGSYIEACQNPSNYDACFDQYAIHEFGHVLGFQHEQDRWDRPCGCETGGQTLYPSTTVAYVPGIGDYGGFDNKSIMVYGGECRDGSSTSVRFGSPTVDSVDITALRQYYGAPCPGRDRIALLSSSRDPAPKSSTLVRCDPPPTTIVPVATGQYCREGLCIPDSNDPHHPKFHRFEPITPRPPGVSQEQFNVGCGMDQRSNPYKISPDGSIRVRVECTNNCEMNQTWWFRDHWTVTCWVEASGRGWTDYRCQNWNTIWGDSWYAWFEGKCNSSVKEKPKEPIAGPKFCHDGECIPDSNDPHHPKHYLTYPLTPRKGDQVGADYDVTGKFNAITTTPHYTISPDGAITVNLRCPNNTSLKESNWHRDHWTVTCWVEWSEQRLTRYRCKNWNTIWGDSWPAWFDVNCPSCVAPPPADRK